MNEPTKPYELTFDKRQDYLYARITAEETDPATALDYWKAIVAKCHEYDAKRLLVKQMIPGGLSTADTFNLAGEVARMGIFGLKVAFVDPFTENYEAHQFGEMVASNRGMWAKVFTTTPEAENWLLQSQFHG